MSKTLTLTTAIFSALATGMTVKGHNVDYIVTKNNGVAEIASIPKDVKDVNNITHLGKATVSLVYEIAKIEMAI